MPRRFLLLFIVCLAAPAHAVEPPLLPWLKADKVVVHKRARTLTIYKDGEELKTYDVALGKQPRGAKIEEGDHRTPEGAYLIDTRNPNSEFYKSLHISYPNEADIDRARELGVKPGSAIFIHGLSQRMEEKGKYHRFYDWTKGCIAVTNREMDELYRAIDDFTPIQILP